MLICPHSGIGNQIGNYVFAQYLIFLGKDIKFLFSKDESIDRAFVLDKFNTELIEAAKEDIETFLRAKVPVSLYGTLFCNIAFRKRTYFNSFYKVLTRIRTKYGIYPVKTPALMAKTVSYKDVLKNVSQGKTLPENIAVCDCYAPLPEFLDPKFKEKMKKHFVLKEEFQGENAAILEKIKACENSVGIHIRRGDYIGLKIPVVKKEFIISKMNILCEKLKGVKFFIFSDSIDWAKENLSDKGFSGLEFVDINDEAHGYLDFALLNNCYHRIYSASSFSLWLKYLNPYNDSIQFYPEEKDLVVE